MFFFTVNGPAERVGSVGRAFGRLAPNETRRTTAGRGDACISVFNFADPGDEIFVEFDVISNGRLARFRAGPFVAGQITGGQTVQPIRIPITLGQ